MIPWVSLLDWTPAYIEQHGWYKRMFNVKQVTMYTVNQNPEQKTFPNTYNYYMLTTKKI